MRQARGACSSTAECGRRIRPHIRRKNGCQAASCSVCYECLSWRRDPRDKLSADRLSRWRHRAHHRHHLSRRRGRLSRRASYSASYSASYRALVLFRPRRPHKPRLVRGDLSRVTRLVLDTNKSATKKSIRPAGREQTNDDLLPTTYAYIQIIYPSIVSGVQHLT